MLLLRYITGFILVAAVGLTTVSCERDKASKINPMTLRLVVTADLKGMIRECDCPNGQPAGLARRMTIFENIRATSPDAAFIDCGQLTDDQMKPPEGALLYELYQSLNYDMVCSYLSDYDRLRDTHLKYTHLKQIRYNFGNLYIRGRDFRLSQLRDPETERNNWKGSIYSSPLKTEDQFLNLRMFSWTDISPEDDEEYELSAPLPEWGLMDWESFSGRINIKIQEFNGLTGLVYNWNDEDEDPAVYSAQIGRSLPGLDIVILGSTDFVEPDVQFENNILTLFPGLYGEFVLILNIWSEDSKTISKYEWETIATETALPDTTFNSSILDFYGDLALKK